MDSNNHFISQPFMAPSSTKIYSFTVVALVDGEQTLYDIRNQELSTAFIQAFCCAMYIFTTMSKGV